MTKMTARFSTKLLSWLLILAMALSLLPTAALAEDKQIPPTQILKCETNYGYDFKLTFSSEFSDWLLSVKSVTVANTSYTKVDSSYGVWNDTDYYIGGDYLLIGEGFTGNSATCVIEAEGYRALTLTLDKTTHSAEIVSAQEPETGGDSENGNGSSEDEGKEPEQGDATSAVTVPEFSDIKNSYYILAFQTQDYVSGISNVLVNSQECQQGISATFLSGTQYYKNAAENKLYLANTQWGSDPTFQNGDIITIQNSSYQDLVLKVTIAGNTVNIGPNDGGDEDEYILHVRLVGSFEAALVGQADYDAVSSASTNVTTNKNSNVEVQGALIQGNEPDNSDWKPLHQLGITVNKNTTSVSISPDGSGMVGVYSVYDSSLTLAGTPEKAGSYQISVTVSDGQGRTATSNKLPFNVYSGNETLADRLTLENCTQTSDGKYMWDMEPWAIANFGGTDDTVTVPEGLKAWYGSHTSGTYGELGYAVANDAAPTQTLIVPSGCNLTLVNMDVLSSVKIVVQDGGKLVLRDSVIQGIVEVGGGGAFSMNYNDYGEGAFESGASINGQLILKDGATLENASIYSNTNNIANGNVARHNTSPVVVVNGNVSMKGNVFIRGDEAASGTDEATGKSYSGQPALQVNGTLTIPSSSILAAYGGGMKATTSVGGDAVILNNGAITGGGKLVAIGGDGEYDDGGDAVTGTGTISTSEAFLQGGSTFMPKDDSVPGQAAAGGVTVVDTTKAVLKNGIFYTNTTDDPNTPHWTGTEVPDEVLLSKYDVATYVLMNIPYADFYAAEKSGIDTAASVDAISSATLNKTRSTLAAGSYHENSDGTDITGIIYPVQISDASVLSGFQQITDESSVTCTVNLRGKEVTTTYTGKDALFEQSSYAYYVLTEKPASYKALTVDSAGKFSFGPVTATAVKVSGASAELNFNDRHVDYAITVKNMDGVTAENVSGVTLHTTASNVYGLRHVYEIWRGTELGFSITGENGDYQALVGQTIDKITYYLNDGQILYVETNLSIPQLVTTTITVDGKEISYKSGSQLSFENVSLGDKTLFSSGADDAYLVTINGETKPVGDTTLKRWVGTWENWQDWIYPTDEMLARYPYLDQAWEQAYAAYIKTFEAAGMGDYIKGQFPNVDALKAYWYGMTDTKGVASIQVTEEDDGSYKLSWLDKDGEVLASDSYTMTGKVLNGLEGAEMYVFTAGTLEDTSDYKYFVTMAPDMEGEEETPIAAHYHFQFGSDLSKILKNGQLHNAIATNEAGRAVSDMVDTKWYATMINADATDLAKYNVILGMHRADKLSANGGILSAIAGENGTTYKPLFDCILDEQYAQYWHDYCAAVLGAENGALDSIVTYLQTVCNGELYGEAAMNAYKNDPEAAQFCCDFINDVETISVSGNNTITIKRAWSTVSYQYAYQGPVTVGEGDMSFTGDLYMTEDEDAGEFKYFLFRDDTPDETYHIEFRYGSSLEQLKGYITGNYAYWLAAGIPVDADEATIKNCIALFCLENMDYSGDRSTESLSQITDLVGTWDYYVNGTALPDTLYFTIDAKGQGTSYYLGEKSSTYQAYAYDNGSDGKSGVYVARNANEEISWADYEITVSAGKTYLTFKGYEGSELYTLTYAKHTSSSGGSSSGGTATQPTASEGSTVAPTVSVKDGEAKAEVSQKDVSNAIDAAKKDGVSTIVIAPVIKGDADKVAVALPKSAAQSIVKDTDAALNVQTDVGALNIPNDTLSEILSAAGGSDITMSMEKADTAAVKDKLPESATVDGAVAVEFKITSGSKTISDFGGKSLEVSVPVSTRDYSEGKTYVAYIISDDGKVETTTATIKDGAAVITMRHFSTVVVTKEESAAFTDVAAGEYYYDAVLWAVSEGITSGTTATTFSPNASCTRGQMVTFLWRAAGSPKASGSNPFSDVSSDAYYYDAVLWAVENGITSGASATTFAPNATVTRSQTVTFLYRAAGSPAASDSGFSDVSSDAYYANAVAWAVQNGITSGTGNRQFSPNADCTRAQIVTFLYRNAVE